MISVSLGTQTPLPFLRGVPRLDFNGVERELNSTTNMIYDKIEFITYSTNILMFTTSHIIFFYAYGKGNIKPGYPYLPVFKYYLNL